MISKKTIAMLVCCCAALIIGCGTKKEEKPLVLVSYGPTDIHAGKDFNFVQSAQINAIWAVTENVSPTTDLVLNGEVLPLPSRATDGKAMTAAVPKKFFETPGNYPLYLLDKKSKRKSNEIKFIVKP